MSAQIDLTGYRGAVSYLEQIRQVYEKTGDVSFHANLLLEILGQRLSPPDDLVAKTHQAFDAYNKLEWQVLQESLPDFTITLQKISAAYGPPSSAFSFVFDAMKGYFVTDEQIDALGENMKKLRLTTYRQNYRAVLETFVEVAKKYVTFLEQQIQNPGFAAPPPVGSA